MLYRYSKWDGSQEVDPFTPEDLMDGLADDLMDSGDLQSALQRLFRGGRAAPDGQQIPGLQDLLKKLRGRRQEELNRYDLGSMMEDIEKRLEDVIQTEKHGIQRRLDQAGRPTDQGKPPSPGLRKALEKIAGQKREALDRLPPDPAGRIKGLSDYDFMDQEARSKFDELMKMLQQQMLGNQFEGLKKSLQGMTPQDMQSLREMVRDLNQMLRDKLQGGKPDFQGFMDKHGQFFPPGVSSLDDLIEHLQRRAAQMQSLLNSMTPEMRQNLQQMMNDLLRDDRLRWDMLQLADNLERNPPMQQFKSRYPFKGDESLTMEEAMRLMERLQQMDDLERELRQAQNAADLDKVDAEKVNDLAGPEAAEQLEQLRRLMKLLEDSGYLEKKGDRYELTAKAIRRIGQKALRDIFGRLKKDAFGKHETEIRGTGGERSEDSKPYEFGDPFLIDLEETLMNSLVREGAHPGPLPSGERQGEGRRSGGQSLPLPMRERQGDGRRSSGQSLPLPMRERQGDGRRSGARPLVHIHPEDFAVYKTEHLTESSIVLMVDMSRSMLLRGCFAAAKKVALALNSLIKGQYPNDNLYIVMFSEYARQVRPEVLPELAWDEETYGTNLHHALILARRLLGKHKMGNRQVIVITDGEPTAHLEGEVAHFSYPPLPRTLIETLKEVARCTKDRIVINTFMLEQNRSLVDFVTQMTKINRGRAFFCPPERLGEYVLVDYVASKRKRVV